MTAVRKSGILLAACGLALAACSGDDNGAVDGDGNGVVDMSASEIVAEAQSAVEAADSLRVSGDMVEAGSKIALDLELTADGASGTMSSDGTTFELLSVDDQVYLRADAETWTAIGDPAAAELLADRYVLIPPDQPSFESFHEFESIGNFTELLLTAEGSVTKGDEVEVNGEQTIGVGSSEGGTLYVATTGEPLPLRLESPEDGESGHIDFEWGVSVDIEAPEDADVVDLSTIMQGQ